MTASTSNMSRNSNSHPSKVDCELLYNLYKQGKVGFVASFLCSLIVLLALMDTVNRTHVIIWFMFLCIVTLFRIILTYSFSQQTHSEQHIKLWLRLYIIGAFFNGFAWGLLGTSYFIFFGKLHQTLALIILAGITSGAVPLLSYFYSSAIAFLIPALLPLIITQFIHFTELNILFGISITVYLAYLIMLCFKTNSILKESIGLRFENDQLLYNLSEAKYNLEIINKQLEDAATHDPLTHIANRTLFILMIHNAIQNAILRNKHLYLFYLDLDHFKNINDHYGHAYGDQLLIAITQRIKYLLRKNDIMARLGGDEFTIILEDIDEQSIKTIAERICSAIAMPFKINEIQITIHISIGISIYPNDNQSADGLIKTADEAMYFAKQQGGNRYCFYRDAQKSTH